MKYIKELIQKLRKYFKQDECDADGIFQPVSKGQPLGGTFEAVQ